MQSSGCSAQPGKPRRFDVGRRTTTYTGPKSRGAQKEDKNKNAMTSSSPRRVTKAPVAPPRTRPVAQPRVPLSQSRFGAQKPSSVPFKSTKAKPKSVRPAAAPAKILPPLPPAPSLLPLDPNCNEPSLPCLCCDGRSPQDNNSMFNHNHNNNNTVSLRHQLQLPPPPPVVAAQRKNGTGAKELPRSPSQAKPEPPPQPASNEDVLETPDLEDKKDVKSEEEDDESSSGDIDIDDEDDDDGDRDDEDDDDTLVPSCCDCPPSLLEFSLSSSTSSSSTSISSCSDLESDCADQYTPQYQDLLSVSIKESSPQCQPPARSLPSLPISHIPFTLTSRTPISSPDEGYPSALDTPSPDYLGVKEDPEVTKLGLLDFLESVGEFGKMERFSQVIQMARWDLEGEQNWDVLRDRLDHLDRLEKVNREIKLAYIARLHEKGFDLGDLEEQDLSDVMDEMGNVDTGWKLYKSGGRFMGESQEFSDAGVDLTAPSDNDDPLAPDSLTPSPAEPPPRPPKPPARHASVNSDLHTYINISRETTSMAVSTSPTLSTFSPNSSSPTFTTFRCEKSLPPSPPSIPPLPVSKPVQYLTLYTTSSPSIPTPTPPIPPPRKRHLARKEAQRLAALQTEQEKTPLSLPPPTTRPPPLPPPPVISSSLPPPSIPPPALPPPPSFHALDVEIRKLLMLAGLTQAELLKLSPELGDCVGVLEEEDVGFRLQEDFSECDPEIVEKDRCSRRGKSGGDGRADIPREEGKEVQRTTSFSEMARRRKSSIQTSDTYYSTALSHTQDTKAKNMSFESRHYEALDSPPPPPPPRPLPPIPPSVPPLRISTLLANSARPDRFDWLIAFTPEVDTPPQSTQLKKSHLETEKKNSQVPKVTSFKELRYRNKSGAPTTKVITDPDPDPSVITPDPDILYNLKWRREKEGSGGSQWEYTSQAQALFMQPPPALTSMAALKEMLQRADEESGRGDKLGCSLSDSSLWTTSRVWEREDVVRKEDKERREEEEAEVRGQADGGRTLESRTTVSSPPLCLTQPPQPYFLHAAPTSYQQGHFHINSRPHTHVGRESSDRRGDPQWADAVLSNQSRADFVSPNRGKELTQNTAKQFSSGSRIDDTLGSQCNLDSLYCSNKQSIADIRAADAPECTTPYKNIDVMMTHPCGPKKQTERNANNTRTSKELPPLPTYYLHRSKYCPLHGGSPPRLSPIGALSPPQRSGGFPPGVAGSGLTSPLFPRSRTLPALAAPLYYPHLYPTIPLCAPPLPPKLYQASRQPRVATVRSVSFAGAVQRGDASWMGDDVPHPMRGHRLSSLHLLEKRALVSAVSVAVEAILAQFSSSRTVVQKALSGDSTVNPSLGRLVLQCLCPALHSLLTDGLKPHQSDLIAGRRPNSAWSLVLASTRPGPKRQALFNLQVRVGELPQLKQSKHRFNAFVLGLLNSKQLDFWVSHLHSSSDVLDAYYRPSSFMRLSLSACQSLFDELLLVLQPLSLLTFNLDLLFQHHHLEPHGPAPQVRSPPSQDAGPSTKAIRSEMRGGRYMESLSEVDFSGPGHQAADEGKTTPSNAGWSLTLDHTSPQLRWVQDKRIGELPPPNLEEESLAQQAGEVIQQGWGAVMRWGGRLSQNLAELNLKKEEAATSEPDQQVQTRSDFAPVSPVAQVPWSLGRLFGSTSSKSPNSPVGHAPPSRRPSQWLAPGVTALTRLVSSTSAPVLRKSPEPMEESHAMSERASDTPETTDKPHRSVRTLCDHAGAGPELSFHKGEELVVLGGVDQDWIRCRQGDREGLVPIGYTSLIM
ncbi:RUN and SH3 domain containing 1 isoform X2 [Vanacampus margaritifer]